MSAPSNFRSSAVRVIEAIGNDLAPTDQVATEETTQLEPLVAGPTRRMRRLATDEITQELVMARGTQPRARRYSDRPTDARLVRPSVVIDSPDLDELTETLS